MNTTTTRTLTTISLATLALTGCTQTQEEPTTPQTSPDTTLQDNAYIQQLGDHYVTGNREELLHIGYEHVCYLLEEQQTINGRVIQGTITSTADNNDIQPYTAGRIVEASTDYLCPETQNRFEPDVYQTGPYKNKTFY